MTIEFDPEMPFLRPALDVPSAQEALRESLCRDERARDVILTAARLVRHKPGRRCLIQYDIQLQRDGGAWEPMTLLGKARAKGVDRITLDLSRHLRRAGFSEECDDGICVPEPMGAVPRFNMWLQRKIAGMPVAGLLEGPQAGFWGRRIAEAAHKLHAGHFPAPRRHTMTDELMILHQRLAEVADSEPRSAGRLHRILEACNQVGEATPEIRASGIHRDFYPDQVLINGARIYLVDLDLFCLGDPALDIGNFLAHLTEQALRRLGDPFALAQCQAAVRERFLDLSGHDRRPAVDAFTVLSLVRHIYLSTRIPGREGCTLALIELCEELLQVS